jgi:hypothetical protein
MFSVYFRIMVTVVVVFGIAGCGSSNQGQSNMKSYPQDGYMGMTSVGPNNLMNPAYHHYQDDTNLMKAVLAQFPDIKNSRITLRGPIADVSVRFREGLGAAREDELRSAVQGALSTNMPRYTVRVYNQRK